MSALFITSWSFAPTENSSFRFGGGAETFQILLHSRFAQRRTGSSVLSCITLLYQHHCYKQNHWLLVCSECNSRCCSLPFKTLNGLAPIYLEDLPLTPEINGEGSSYAVCYHWKCNCDTEQVHYGMAAYIWNFLLLDTKLAYFLTVTESLFSIALRG